MAVETWISVFQDTLDEHEIQDKWTIDFDDALTLQGWDQYISGSFARFQCSECKRTWPSKRVPVVFNMILELDKTGKVKVRCVRQECKKCANPKMEEPRFASENIEVLLERLVKKILIRFYNEDMGAKNNTFHHVGRIDGPHETAHCEGCKLGICRQGMT
ncbi:receptor-transporting protein 3-like [Aplochiton taeniatus]